MNEKHDFVLIGDNRIRSIPSCDVGEPFVDLLKHSDELYCNRERLKNKKISSFFGYIRAQVFEKLLEAQSCLSPTIRFFINEGFRPVSLQQMYFDEYKIKIQKCNPGISEEDLITEVSKYVAPPDVAPHSTGGAVDIGLMFSNGSVIDMGSNFDVDFFGKNPLCYFSINNLKEEYRKYRNILKECMEPTFVT